MSTKRMSKWGITIVVKICVAKCGLQHGAGIYYGRLFDLSNKTWILMPIRLQVLLLLPPSASIYRWNYSFENRWLDNGPKMRSPTLCTESFRLRKPKLPSLRAVYIYFNFLLSYTHCRHCFTTAWSWGGLSKYDVVQPQRCVNPHNGEKSSP